MMRQYWWKILGVLLFTYVLIVGLLTPLKPGIFSVSHLTASVGTTLPLEVQSYNTNYTKANKLRAWLKIDSIHILEASNIVVQSDNQLLVTLDIPKFLPNEQLTQAATLIIDNDYEGHSILPAAIFISKSKDTTNVAVGHTLWSMTEIKDITHTKGFKFPYQNILNETSRNLFFHVAIWFAMFTLLIIALVYSIKYLMSSEIRYDIYASSLTSVAITFGIVGMLTGSFWAKYTWGQYWINDVKLNMSAVALLIYFAYWILRSSMKDQDQRAKVSAVYSVFAFAALIPLVFVIPRLTDSMHPGNGGNPAFSKDDLDNTMRFVFYPAIIGLILIGLWISSLSIRYEIIKETYYLRNAKKRTI